MLSRTIVYFIPKTAVFFVSMIIKCKIKPLPAASKDVSTVTGQSEDLPWVDVVGRVYPPVPDTFILAKVVI